MEPSVGYDFMSDSIPGHFAVLNLTYFATVNQVRRAGQTIRENILEFLQGHDSHQTRNEILLKRIDDAANILSSTEARRRYVEDLKVRFVLSQANSLEEVLSKNVGRVFPYLLFCVSKVSSGKGTPIMLSIDFFEGEIDEKRGETSLGTFLFTSVVSAIPGLTRNEVAVSYSSGNGKSNAVVYLSLIHISEPTRQAEISYAVFCLKKKNKSPGKGGQRG
eukprot:TRINITY_DN3082_c0_g1_i9.p1 TRINITY_DN3082_c0_g1~~TRINITY_DN3082_c0_g1_i9.p1  ORF type:complete len:219 (-),score=20.69 TRINITY_DN3082_c0_g1_i9:12-668(-)